MHLTRYSMYKQIFASLPLPLTGNILGVSGLKYWIGSKNYTPPQEIISGEAAITNATYPEMNICALPYPENTFDWVICDQVLEHVEGDIQKAVDEVRRVLKPGSQAIFASPFLYPIHWGPKDLWRFSPDGWKYLCRNFSEIITCDSWGNRWANTLFFLNDKARDWQVPEQNWSFVHYLATKNDPKYPIMVWVTAKK